MSAANLFSWVFLLLGKPLVAIIPITILYFMLGGAGAWTIISNGKIIAIIFGIIMFIYVIYKLK